MIFAEYIFSILQRFEFHGELVLIAIKRKTYQFFLSQTVRASAFIFGMEHDLVALYQNTSNYGLGVEISPMLWGLKISQRDKEEKS